MNILGLRYSPEMVQGIQPLIERTCQRRCPIVTHVEGLPSTSSVSQSTVVRHLSKAKSEVGDVILRLFRLQTIGFKVLNSKVEYCRSCLE